MTMVYPSSRSTRTTRSGTDAFEPRGQRTGFVASESALNTSGKSLRDVPHLQFRFLIRPTSAMRAKACRLVERVRGFAIDTGCCRCAPWDDCDHVDVRLIEQWWERGRKLSQADDDALMRVFSAPTTQGAWSVLDRLVLGEDGVCRL